MLKAKDIMTKELVTVSPQTEITIAAKILLEKRINGLPVIDDSGKLVGILCQSDLVAQQKSIPIPSVYTLLDSFIPLTSLKRIDKEVKKIAALKVEQAMTSQREDCAGMYLGGGSVACQKATQKLAQAILAVLNDGVELPPPEKVPAWSRSND